MKKYLILPIIPFLLFSCGDDDPLSSPPNSSVKAALSFQIEAGGNHTCAIFSGGTLKCWGLGSHGQLGQDSTSNLGHSAGSSIASLSNINLGARLTATQVSAGGFHTCAILNTGNVRCWGNSGEGQLGYNSHLRVSDGIGNSIATQGDVNLGTGLTATQISAGGEHTCAILNTGNVRCWGNGLNGRLGYNSTTNIGDGAGNSIAAQGDVNLGVGLTATEISAGSSHTCAILNTGNVRCWGNGLIGQLGYNSTANVGDGIGNSIAAQGDVNLGSGLTATQISAGSNHTCALLNTGNIRCWGFGNNGQLGYDATASVIGNGVGNSIAAQGDVFLGPGLTATQISSRGNHSCALLNTGAVRCWGLGTSGQLGNNSTANIGDGRSQSIVTQGDINLGTGLTATKIVTSNNHTCAILNTGNLRCWGAGNTGALGYNSSANVGDGTGNSIAAQGDVPLGN